MNANRHEGRPAERRLRMVLAPGIASGLALAAVVAILAAAISIPAVAVLGDRPDASVLGYANSGPGSFSPLDDGFVRGRLGALFSPEANGAPAARGGAARHGGRRASRLPDPVEQPALSNDHFADASAIPRVPYRGTTTTQGASRDAGEPTDCLPVGGTVWYRYTPATGGDLVANTFGSNYALSLGVFTGASLGDLRQVACDTNPRGNAFETFPAVAEKTYWFQLSAPVGGGRLLFTLVSQAQTNEVSATHDQGDSAYWTSLTPDGRYVVFTSPSPNYAWDPAACKANRGGCTNLVWRDLAGGTTKTLVSILSTNDPEFSQFGSALNANAISADGMTVAFDTYGPVSLDGKKTPWSEVWVIDVPTERLTRVSRSWRGGDASLQPYPLREVYATAYGSYSTYDGALTPSLSHDGRYVAFMSTYADLYENEPATLYEQIFVKDLKTGVTKMVSVNGKGRPANGDSYLTPSSRTISADGRQVTFWSDASDLPGLIMGAGCAPIVAYTCRSNVYVADVERAAVTYVSKTSTGLPDGDSYLPSISSDGDHVVFVSDNGHLVADDTNQSADVFEWSRKTDSIALVSIDTSGSQGTGDFASLSTAGLYGLYALSEGCRTLTSACPVTRALIPQFGLLFNAGTPMATTSADGRYVAFNTIAALSRDDTNGTMDVYVRDTVLGTTVRASVGPGGLQSNGTSFFPTITDDASAVGFTSTASNLVAHDPNGSGWSVFVRTLNWTS